LKRPFFSPRLNTPNLTVNLSDVYCTLTRIVK